MEMEGSIAASPSFTRRWWWVALIFAAAFTACWPALPGGRLWDDDAHITRPALQSAAGLWGIWTDLHATQQYYPLLHSAFWFEHKLWGDATLGYHLLNVLLHAISACLLVVLLRRLRLPGAILAGLIFAVHPVCVESVAWISEQKNTLSLVFYLLATLAYLRFDGARGQPVARRAYVAASVLFACALLTKSVTATLPAALLVLQWWRQGRLAWRRDVAPLAPWFAAALASGLFTAWIERTIGGAAGGEFSLTLGQRCLLAGRILWFYLGKLLWPTHLAFIYPRWDVRAEAAGWAGYLVAALLLTAVLWLVRRRSRGPLAAWLLYAGTLFPALGFFNVYPFLFSYVADHFQYHASLAIIAAIAAGAAGLLNRATAAYRTAGRFAGAALIAGLTLLSHLHSEIFVDQRTVFAATLAQNPRCWLAHDGLGLWFKDHGDRARAIDHFQAALRLRSDYPQAHNNLGLCYEDAGDLDRAIAEFREALRLKPDLAEAHNNLGGALVRSPDRANEAIAEFQEAVRLQPEFVEARNNLGNALLKIPGRLPDAIAQFRQAIRLRPDLAESYANLGDALLQLSGRADDAIAAYAEAVHLNPGNAEFRSNLGLALNSQGRAGEAIAQFKEALRLRPDFAEIRLNLAIALLNTPGGRNEAFAQVEAYLEVRPPNDMTRQLLAWIQEHP